MIDHTGVIVSNFELSRNWYEDALKPIGYAKLYEFDGKLSGSDGVAGFGEASSGKPDFWICGATKDKPVNSPVIHVAFRAQNRQEVDAFYNTALNTGGKDNGKPGIRPHYHENYYGAFVLDPDGHNIEVVCHNPEE